MELNAPPCNHIRIGANKEDAAARKCNHRQQHVAANVINLPAAVPRPKKKKKNVSKEAVGKEFQC